MPDLTEQVRKALRDKCGCELPAGLQYDADGISSPGFYRSAIRDCPKCLSAAVARALEDVKSLVCDTLRGDDWYEEDIASELVEMELRFVRALREGR